MGQMVNELVERVTGAAGERQRDIERAARARGLETEALDLTRPAPPLRRGRLNPVTLAAIEIRRIFAQLGYAAVEGPEVEYDRYNFTLVNQPPGHPARDSQDTFYIDDSRLLRQIADCADSRGFQAVGREDSGLRRDNGVAIDRYRLPDAYDRGGAACVKARTCG